MAKKSKKPAKKQEITVTGEQKWNNLKLDSDILEQDFITINAMKQKYVEKNQDINDILADVEMNQKYTIKNKAKEKEKAARIKSLIQNIENNSKKEQLNR